MPSHEDASTSQLDTSSLLPTITAAASCPSTSFNSNPPIQIRQWEMCRPVLSSCPQQTRRQLRALGRTWTLEEVRQHRYKDDAWIAVDGKVYDITEHIVDHPGWDTGPGISTILSILAHAGSECTTEFREIHRPYPIAFKQLRAFYIGELQDTVLERMNEDTLGRFMCALPFLQGVSEDWRRVWQSRCRRRRR